VKQIFGETYCLSRQDSGVNSARNHKETQHKALFVACLMLDLLFSPEDGGYTFSRKVG
jgi:hypothetical protein